MKRKPTKRSKEGQRALNEFRDQWIGRLCWYCWTNDATDIHHIVKRRGEAYDVLCNFFACCRWCHQRIEGETLVWNGIRQPTIPVDVVLRLKKIHDRENWKLAELRLLAGPGDGRLNMELGRGME